MYLPETRPWFVGMPLKPDAEEDCGLSRLPEKAEGFREAPVREEPVSASPVERAPVG
jgi:hypothetical protein